MQPRTLQSVSSRLRVKPGDLFAVRLGPDQYLAMQFIVRDRSQLSSDVVVIYSPRFTGVEDLRCQLPSDRSVLFYTHTSVAVGAKAGWWEHVGNAPLPNVDLVFRCTDDVASEVTTSDRWYWWRANGEYQSIGRLNDKYSGAEIGSVFGPPAVVERIRTGQLTHRFPDERSG